MISSETKERLIDTIGLLGIPGIGRERFDKLTKRFGSPGAALAASTEELVAVPGLSKKTVRSIKSKYDSDRARSVAARIAQLGWVVLFPDSTEYPTLLNNIHGRPPVLFREGSASSPDDKIIAIVGTRHASETGRRFAHRLAAELVDEGLIVVSGMAEGIDAAAHRGALEAGGNTIAVWGTPLDQVFPSSHRDLAAEIKIRGTVYSEYLPGTPTDPSNFPERNRIISGLSEGVVVVEAGQRSGALITAQFALDQNRELFAVPGNPGSSRSIGTNQLIRQGAKLITGGRDILDEIPRLKSEIKAVKFKQKPDLTEIELKIVDSLTPGAQQIDHLGRVINMPVAELMQYLLALELKGVITELPGKRFILSDQ